MNLGHSALILSSLHSMDRINFNSFTHQAPEFVFLKVFSFSCGFLFPFDGDDGVHFLDKLALCLLLEQECSTKRKFSLRLQMLRQNVFFYVFFLLMNKDLLVLETDKRFR